MKILSHSLLSSSLILYLNSVSCSLCCLCWHLYGLLPILLLSLPLLNLISKKWSKWNDMRFIDPQIQISLSFHSWNSCHVAPEYWLAILSAYHLLDSQHYQILFTSLPLFEIKLSEFSSRWTFDAFDWLSTPALKMTSIAKMIIIGAHFILILFWWAQPLVPKQLYAINQKLSSWWKSSGTRLSENTAKHHHCCYYVHADCIHELGREYARRSHFVCITGQIDDERVFLSKCRILQLS